MSNEQEDGGPAADMTLRDYFAAKAMQAMLSIEQVHLSYAETQIAVWSYQQADAMLAERNRK